MKICYIVGAGDFNSYFTPNEDDLVIAADGGYDTLKKNGIRCDVLIGDLDSVSEAPQDVISIKHPVEKNETDMHLSYLYGKEKGYSEFRIYGGCGGRSDHTFANYCLLLNIKENMGNAIMYDGNTHIRVIKNEKITLIGNAGSNLSIFAFGGDAHGVSIHGAKYSAHNVTLTSSFPLGVSNSFLDTPAEVEVKNGVLLIIYSALVP